MSPRDGLVHVVASLPQLCMRSLSVSDNIWSMSQGVKGYDEKPLTRIRCQPFGWRYRHSWKRFLVGQNASATETSELSRCRAKELLTLSGGRWELRGPQYELRLAGWFEGRHQLLF